MSRKCTICQHEKRKEIEAAVVTGESLRSIAGRHDITRTSLSRHLNNCLSRSARKAREVLEEGGSGKDALDVMIREEAIAADVLSIEFVRRTLGFVVNKAVAALEMVEGKKEIDVRAIAPLLREIRAAGEASGKLQLGGAALAVKGEDIRRNDAYRRLKATLLSATATCPTCRARLAEALDED